MSRLCALLTSVIYYSTPGTVVTVSKAESEAVSLGNENETSDTGETPITLGDASKDFHDPPDNPGGLCADDPSNVFAKNGLSDVIPKTDEDELSEDLVEV